MHDAETGHKFTVILSIGPFGLEHAKGVQMTVIHLVALEGEENCAESNDGAHPFVLSVMFQEFMIFCFSEFLHVFFADLVLLELVKLVFWDISGAERAIEH